MKTSRNIARACSFRLTSLFAGLFAGALTGCSHAPLTQGYSAEQLLAFACSPGAETQEVKGTAIMKLASPDASGTFPATIHARATDGLKVEVNNLIGGVEAIIEVRAGQYSVRVPSHPEKNSSGKGTWGGIPLVWANTLFLGKIPCPAASDAGRLHYEMEGPSQVAVQVHPNGNPEIEEIFQFEFKKVKGKPWPASLKWERKAQGRSIDVNFTFEDADDASGSPLRWSARSGSGKVKVRWKERENLR